MHHYRCVRERACLDVGSMAVPKIFGLAFTGGGEVLRVGLLIWRQGERLGAPSVTAKELRQVLQPDRGRIDQD